MEITASGTGQPPALSVENDVGYPISVGFSWDVFGFALGIVLCSFAGAISVVFQVQVDVIRAILISGASSVLASDAGLELTLGDSPSHVIVMVAMTVSHMNNRWKLSFYDDPSVQRCLVSI